MCCYFSPPAHLPGQFSCWQFYHVTFLRAVTLMLVLFFFLGLLTSELCHILSYLDLGAHSYLFGRHTYHAEKYLVWGEILGCLLIPYIKIYLGRVHGYMSASKQGVTIILNDVCLCLGHRECLRDGWANLINNFLAS